MSTHGEWIALAASVLAALAIALGARFVLGRKVNAFAEQRLVHMFAFGTGVLFVAVVLDFLPDAWDLAGDKTPWGIFAGILLLWILTQWADRSFVRVQASEAAHYDGPAGSGMAQFTVASAVVLAVSLSAHSVLEGAAVAVATTQVTVSSWVFVAAMLLHKLPEGILWGIALQTAMPSAVRANTKRVWYTLLIPAACTLLGTLAGITFLDLASSSFIGMFSALLCGALLFICLSELFPMLRESTTVPRVNTWFFAGIVVLLIPVGIGMFVGG